MTVTELISVAVSLSFSQLQAIHKTWINISFQVGSVLPDSLLVASIQHVGKLDIFLRSMEDDLSSQQKSFAEAGILSIDIQAMFSKFWICDAYEIFRLLKSRKLLKENPEIEALVRDLALFRIPLEKHKVAKDRKLSQPLQVQRLSSTNEVTGLYEYHPRNDLRPHIMRCRISDLG